MTDRIFTDCCYGTDLQHSVNQPCPFEQRPLTGIPLDCAAYATLKIIDRAFSTDTPKETHHD